MRQAPPIIGQLEFSGMENNIILIEHDEEDCSLDLMGSAIADKVNVIFTPHEFRFNANHSVAVMVDSVSRIYNIMRGLIAVDLYIINRIDLMNLEFSKKERGAQVKAFVSMMCSPRMLQGGNLIATSGKSEYTLREIADTYLNLRK